MLGVACCLVACCGGLSCLGSPQEAKAMMAMLYLDAIKTYPTIRGMKKIAFNYQQFHADVKALFEQEGWLNEENPFK
jgi:hypothetical protein